MEASTAKGVEGLDWRSGHLGCPSPLSIENPTFVISIISISIKQRLVQATSGSHTERLIGLKTQKRPIE
jgi:hypothetical protein